MRATGARPLVTLSSVPSLKVTGHPSDERWNIVRSIQKTGATARALRRRFLRLTDYYLRQGGYVFCLCLSVSRITQKCCRRISIKCFGGVGCANSKKPFDFGDSLLRVTMRIQGILAEFLPLRYTGNCRNFVGSAALVEVCGFQVDSYNYYCCVSSSDFGFDKRRCSTSNQALHR